MEPVGKTRRRVILNFLNFSCNQCRRDDTASFHIFAQVPRDKRNDWLTRCGAGSAG